MQKDYHMRTDDADEDIVKKIETGGRDLEVSMRELYADASAKSQLLGFIRRNGGNAADAEDVFQEGVRNVIMNIRANKYLQEGSLKAYLLSICKNIWRTQFKRSIHLNRIKDEIGVRDKVEADSPAKELLWSERADLLADVLKNVSEVCREILSLWSLGYSFREIGEKTNRNEGAARKQKHSCFKKLMLYLKSNPNLMEELKQLKLN